jgi:serine/threonine-protein kinase
MAEILLARLVGPSGFERPVVIKRIRRDLDHEELVELFLEEARLAAKVRHANVVAVEDLGTDDGSPYLVMEYLEGESLSNVTRRLKTREETLPFGLIAFIVSEACAGLHAAHELRDSHGEPLGIVHRDVSPQNVFVTYDGAIKVVDFGIARSQTSTETEPGTVRGKFGYMAPEQMKRGVIDRRTDVFTLGIVLYECLTGHRLFKRFNVMATMRAVVSDPIVAPRRVEPKVPRSLEAICLRALARQPEDRYATAGEMRRELLVAMRDLASEEPSAELSELMVRCFPDRIGDKRILLRNVREGSVVDHIPVGDIDVAIDFPGIEDVPVGAEWGPASVRPLPLPPPSDAVPPSERVTTLAPPPGSVTTQAPPPGSVTTQAPPPVSYVSTQAPPPAHLTVLGTPPSMSTLASSTNELPLPRARRSRSRWVVALLLIAAGVAFVSTRVIRKTNAAVPPSDPAAQPLGALSIATATVASLPSAGATAGAQPESAAAQLVPIPPSALRPVPASPSVNRRPRPAAPTTTSTPTSASTALIPAPQGPPPDETAAPNPSASSRGFRRFQ